MTTYWNGAASPVLAVIVKSASINLYVPLDCVDDVVVIVKPDKFVYEIWVRFDNWVLVATGAFAAAQSATFNVSDPRLCTLFATAAVNELNFVNVFEVHDLFQ